MNIQKKNYFNSSHMIPMDERFSSYGASELQINFHAACIVSDINLVTYYINNTAIDKRDLSREIKNAIDAKNLNLLKLLIYHDAEMPYRATLYTVQTEDLSLVNYILDYYAENPYYDDDFCNKALCYTTMFSKKLSLIKLIIKKGANIHYANCAALEGAISVGNYDVAEFLISLGATLDSCIQGVTYIVMNCIEREKINNAEKLNFLIKHGVSIEEIKTYATLLKSDFSDDTSINEFIYHHKLSI